MNLKRFLLCTVGCAFASQAHAFDLTPGIDLQAAKTAGLYKDDGTNRRTDADTTGVDYSGFFKLGKTLIAHGEYVLTDADTVETQRQKYPGDAGLKVVRGGIGAAYADPKKRERVYGVAEYIRLTANSAYRTETSDGFGVTLGVSDQAKTKLLYGAEAFLGLVNDKVATAVEVNVGYRVIKHLAVVGGLQFFTFKDTDTNGVWSGYAFVGARVSF